MSDLDEILRNYPADKEPSCRTTHSFGCDCVMQRCADEIRELRAENAKLRAFVKVWDVAHIYHAGFGARIPSANVEALIEARAAIGKLESKSDVK